MKIPFESQLAQALAANDKKRRDGGLKKLGAWMAARSSSEDTSFSEDEIMKLWKGLFYCMWMSDKPLVQEELADSISQMIHSFGNVDASFLFIDCFFKTMNREWPGLDQWRMDKYMMFTRKFLRQCFALVKKLDWSDDVIVRFSGILQKTAARPEGVDLCVGFQIHVADIYIEELAKAASNNVSGQKLVAFFEPYCYLLANSKTTTLRHAVIKRVFEFAIRLSNSEETDDDDDDNDVVDDGEFNDNNDEDTLQEEEYEESDDEVDDELLNVEKKWCRIVERHELRAQELPFPKFDYKGIGDRLLEIVGKAKNCTAKMLKQSHQQVKSLHEMANGIYPLDVVPENIPQDSDAENEEEVEKAVKKLYNYEEKLRQEKLDYVLSKRRRKREYSVPIDSDEDEGSDETNDEDDVVVEEKATKPKLKRKKGKRKKQPQKKFGVSESVKTDNESTAPEVIKDKLLLRLIQKEAAQKLENKKNKRKSVEITIADETPIKQKNNKKLKKETGDDGVTPTSSTKQGNRSLEKSAAKKVNNKKKKNKNKRNIKVCKSDALVNSLDANEGSSSVNDDDKLKLPFSTGETIKSTSNKITKRKGRYFNNTLLDADETASAPAKRSYKMAAAAVVTTSIGNAKAPIISLKPFKKSPPAFFQKAISKAFPKTGKKTTPKKNAKISPSRKVNFELTKNGAQEVKDYALSVRSSPAIPFDSRKLPSQGVLKPGIIRTPVRSQLHSKRKRATAMQFF